MEGTRMTRWLASIEVEYWFWWEQRPLPDLLAAWVLGNRYRAERFHHPHVFRRVTW